MTAWKLGKGLSRRDAETMLGVMGDALEAMTKLNGELVVALGRSELNDAQQTILTNWLAELHRIVEKASIDSTVKLGVRPKRAN